MLTLALCGLSMATVCYCGSDIMEVTDYRAWSSRFLLGTFETSKEKIVLKENTFKVTSQTGAHKQLTGFSNSSASLRGLQIIDITKVCPWWRGCAAEISAIATPPTAALNN